MNTQFPLRECDSCLHQDVCKHQAEIAKLIKKQTVPIDFSTATCTAYLPQDVDIDMYPDEDLMEEREILVGDSVDLIAALNQVLDSFHQQGLKPVSIHLSSLMAAELHQTLLLHNPMHTLMKPGIIATKYGVLKVVVDETIPDGQFHIITEDKSK